MAVAAASLPEDIQIEILSRCPVKCLLRLRCVCKRWRSLISDPQFVQLHLTQSNLSSNKRLLIAPDIICKIEHVRNCYIELVGTCNGLVCLSMNNEEIIVFNPSTKYYKELPLGPLEEGRGLDHYYSCSWGFGYDSSTDDYKVVLGLEGREFLKKIMVFNFKDNAWRIKHEFNENVRISLSNNAVDPVLLNGRVHWMGVRDKIHCFDLCDEGMKEIPTPDELRMFDEIGLVGTSLSVSKYVSDGVGGWILNLWVMKEYDVQTSWVILYKIPNVNYNGLFSPMLCLTNGEICVRLVHKNQSFDLVAYYPREGKQRTIESFRISGAVEGFCGIMVAYKESLVSPNCGRDWKGGNPQFINFMANNVAIFDVESLENAINM